MGTSLFLSIGGYLYTQWSDQSSAKSASGSNNSSSGSSGSSSSSAGGSASRGFYTLRDGDGRASDLRDVHSRSAAYHSASCPVLNPLSLEPTAPVSTTTRSPESERRGLGGEGREGGGEGRGGVGDWNSEPPSISPYFGLGLVMRLSMLLRRPDTHPVLAQLQQWLLHLCTLVDILASALLYCTLFGCFMYGTLRGQGFDAYSDTYTWNVSAVYYMGGVPAALLLLFWSCLLYYLLVRMQVLESATDTHRLLLAD